MSTQCGGTTAAAAAGAACNTWKRLLSLASLWAVCEFVAVKVFFDTDLSSVGRGSLLTDAVGGGGNENGRGRGKKGRFRRRRYTDDGPSFEAPHMQKKAAARKYQQKQREKQVQNQQQKKQKLDDDDAAMPSESEDSQQLDGLGSPSDGTSYHIFQIAKPHTGSTLLNCILQGLLDEPFEKYSFLPIVKPAEDGRFGSYPQGVTESSVENDPYPFILHDGRLKMAEDNMDVTTVTKTHIVDVEELEEEFGHLFERVFYVAANRAAKDITIREEYCELDNVLCIDYDDFAYTPDDSLIDVDMDVDEAVKRVKLMEKATTEMADKSFKEHEPYFGIHGGHRNRDDNNNQQQKEKKGGRLQNKASPQQKLSLVHIAPTYKVKNCAAQFCPYDQDQSVAIASMRRAREQSKKASVTLAASVFPEDGDAVPADFIRLGDLSRSTMSDYPNLPLKKKLPFINDIFDNLRSSSGFNSYDYIIYTNADIIVTEKFYDIVTAAIDSGYDAFTINRQTVAKGKASNHLYTALDLDDIYQLKGKVHPGSDCFVMKRSIFEKIDMGNLFLGYPPTANVLLVQAESLAVRYTMFASNELKATFHLGDDKSWHEKNDANLEYEVTNYENAYNDLHEVWTALCEFSPEYDTRRLNSLKYVGNNMSCSRLANKFYSVAGYDLAKEQREAAGGNQMALASPALAVTGTSSEVKTDSPIVFQFLVGLEGTGHHLHQKLYKGSPAHKRLKSYGLLDDISDLLKSLWNRESPSEGLWSATCAMSNEEKLWWKQENEGTDGEKLFNNLVGHLKSLDAKSRSKVEADEAMQPGDDLVIAVNSGSIYNQEAAPFLSYPLLHGPCRFLQYPILDIFYEACNAAGVRCQHALSFRDPYRVLKSTSMNRHFASRHVQLQTLHSMLGVIQGQMLSHSDRLVACWESDMGANGGASDLAKLFGWKNEAKFDGWYSKIFLEPLPLSEEDKSEITMEKQLEVYMNSMIKDMANIKATCRSQLLFNSPSAPQSFKSPKSAPALLPPRSIQTASNTNHASRATLLSKGEDVDELVPPRPDWLDSYIEYHRSSVEPDGNGGYRLKDGVPFVVYECTDNVKCGGIGDRINSMVLVLYLAMCSGRVLLINAPYPSPLQNFLNPNEVRWDATPPDLGEELQTLDIMDIRNHDLIVDQSIIGYRLGRCNGMPPRHTLKTIWKNQCMSGYFQRIDQIFPFPAEIPEEKLLRWSFWSLFKFSDAVLLRAEELKTSAKLPSDSSGHVSPYLGIHLRTGDRSMDIDNMGLKGPRARYRARQQREYLDCYQRFQQALPDTQIGYVASDSDTAKQKLNRWDSSIHFSDETNIFHVDESLRVAGAEALAGDDTSYQGSLDGWAELSVMVDAECIIMSWSMFSFAAHYIGGENRCGVYVGHCQEENVGNIPHEYSYETG
eukprot:CAMPEP_0178609718 /NCGR_PEP_ID=MMETSP0697-20121206/38789_1 /TAXON_ID=265572 /ORGANISM="Extubocellulus spinifer, Strain CCMP396" /LENGTH=1413 /DNA_ID=CAMNT_0020248299 /DNA_START=166 /DNA_END=4403 /DNA_ORIENTATION=-